MRKIIYGFLVMALITGCSGIKRAEKSTDRHKESDSFVKIEEVKEKNLSTSSFYIQKADVNFDTKNLGMSFTATIKFVVPDKYLISLRMKSGIEIARIYMDSDTVLANDRVNKVLYYGKPGYLSSRYGVPLDLLPAVFGDLIYDKIDKEGEIKCNNGQTSVNAYYKGVKLVYLLDCSSGKPRSLKQESYSGITGEAEFNGNKKSGVHLFPSDIVISHKESDSRIQIKIEKVLTDWNGEIEFIPGNKYEQVELR